MRFLLHVDDQSVVDIIDGIKYEALPGKPLRFDNDHHAQAFLEHKATYGVIECQAKDTETGVVVDLEGSREAAKAALDASETAVVNDYIKTQIEDRIRKNYPAMPPQGRAADIIEKRQVDLKLHGINPVGWMPNENTPTSENFSELKKQNELLAEQNRRLAEQFDAQQKQIDGLMATPVNAKPANKEKAS